MSAASEGIKGGVHSLRNKRTESFKDLLVYLERESPGVGGKCVTDFLDHFGSMENVSNASVSELQEVLGILRSQAELLHKFMGDCSE